MNNESTERLIKEYLSKCRVCDECFAETFCTLKGLRDSREPQERCVDNIKKYFKGREKNRHGHWIDKGTRHFVCSECHTRFVILKEWKWCPVCGARMRKVVKE